MFGNGVSKGFCDDQNHISFTIAWILNRIYELISLIGKGYMIISSRVVERFSRGGDFLSDSTYWWDKGSIVMVTILA